MNARELQSLANLEWDMVIDVRGSHPTDDAQREHAIALLRDLPRRHQITAIDELARDLAETRPVSEVLFDTTAIDATKNASARSETLERMYIKQKRREREFRALNRRESARRLLASLRAGLSRLVGKSH